MRTAKQLANHNSHLKSIATILQVCLLPYLASFLTVYRVFHADAGRRGAWKAPWRLARPISRAERRWSVRHGPPLDQIAEGMSFSLLSIISYRFIAFSTQMPVAGAPGKRHEGWLGRFRVPERPDAATRKGYRRASPVLYVSCFSLSLRAHVMDGLQIVGHLMCCLQFVEV
jgi:hypothetical protein